jgi:ketosteroid isomerase-like protein
VNMLPDPKFDRRCPKCDRVARLLASEREWEFYDCPEHRVVAVLAQRHGLQSTHLSSNSADASARGTRPVATHPGIDQLSWTAFEQRVRARRLDTVVAQAYRALEGRDLLIAQSALNEARELNPHAPAVARLAAEIGRYGSRGPTLHDLRRMAAAAALLVVAVSILLGVERLRQIAPTSSRPSPVISVIDREHRSDAPLVQRPLSSYSQVAHVAPAVEDRPLVWLGTPPKTTARENTPSHSVRRTRMQRLSRSDRNAARTVTSPSPETGPLAPRENDSVGSIAPTTVDVPPPSTPMLERDSTIPGASVALLLSDAAVRVAASAGPGDAAVALTQLAAVLRGYGEAYAALDVSATRRLWPNVDQRALTDAFERSAARHVSLDACDINVQGSTADASCRGSATATRDHGEMRVEARSWRFDLRREGDAWKIANAESSSR